MVERAARHFVANLFAHRDQRNSNRGKALENALVLILKVVSAVLEHALDDEDVAGAGISAHLEKDGHLLVEGGRDGLDGFHRRFGGFLAAKVEEGKAEAEEARHGIAKGAGLALKHRLKEALGELAVAGRNKDKAKSKSSNCRNLRRRVSKKLKKEKCTENAQKGTKTCQKVQKVS